MCLGELMEHWKNSGDTSTLPCGMVYINFYGICSSYSKVAEKMKETVDHFLKFYSLEIVHI